MYFRVVVSTLLLSLTSTLKPRSQARLATQVALQAPAVVLAPVFMRASLICALVRALAASLMVELAVEVKSGRRSGAICSLAAPPLSTLPPSTSPDQKLVVPSAKRPSEFTAATLFTSTICGGSVGFVVERSNLYFLRLPFQCADLPTLKSEKYRSSLVCARLNAFTATDGVTNVPLSCWMSPKMVWSFDVSEGGSVA